MSLLLTATTAAGCTVPLLCNSGGPSTPFGSPLLIVLDLLRVVCIFAAVAALILAPSTTGSLETAQKLRVFALCAFLLEAITTESEHMGDFAGVRLAFNLAGALCALYGMRHMRKEDPARMRSSDDPPPTG